MLLELGNVRYHSFAAVTDVSNACRRVSIQPALASRFWLSVVVYSLCGSTVVRAQVRQGNDSTSVAAACVSLFGLSDSLRKNIVHPASPTGLVVRRRLISDHGISTFSTPVVMGVLPGSPADQAGIRCGDYILRWDGRAITSLASVLMLGERDVALAHDPSTKHVIRIRRSGREFDTTLMTSSR